MTIQNPNPNKTTVGVADLQVMPAGVGQLITHALGSCIGLTIFDPVAQVPGMLHFMLPEPASGLQAKGRPAAMFASTGVPMLFRMAMALGASKSQMIICAAGGSSLMQDNERFQIGKRNRMILHKMFLKNNIQLAAEDTGGNSARTMRIDMSTGQVDILVGGKETILWAP